MYFCFRKEIKDGDRFLAVAGKHKSCNYSANIEHIKLVLLCDGWLTMSSSRKINLSFMATNNTRKHQTRKKQFM